MQMRVATFGISDQMIASALRTQSTMANQQIQEASGLVSSDFGGLGSTTQQVLNLQVSATRSQSYIDAATLTNSKIQVMYSAVNSIADLATQFRALLTSATSASSTDAASVTESARNMLEQTASVLNTQYNGSYLFGGSETKTRRWMFRARVTSATPSRARVTLRNLAVFGRYQLLPGRQPAGLGARIRQPDRVLWRVGGQHRLRKDSCAR